MKKKIMSISILLLFMFLIVGCFKDSDDDLSSSTKKIIEEQIEEAIDSGVSSEDINEVMDEVASQVNLSEIASQDSPDSTTKDDFASIQQFSTLFEDFYDVVDDVGADVEDFTFFGDLMSISIIEMAVLNAELEQAMNGMADSWNNERSQMPNGNGEYVSSLIKDGDKYVFQYDSFYNDSGEQSILLTYSPSDKTIDYSNTATGELVSDYVMQQYIDENGAFYLSYCDYTPHQELSQHIIVYYDGINANYARAINLSEVGLTLPQALLESKPASWNDLFADFSYTSLFTYDGTNVNYQVQE